MKRRGHWAVLLLMTLSGGSLGAQTAGGIGGLVTDDQGLAVPGVTVRLEGDVLIAPLAALTLADGSYRKFGNRPGPRRPARSVSANGSPVAALAKLLGEMGK